MYQCRYKDCGTHYITNDTNNSSWKLFLKVNLNYWSHFRSNFRSFYFNESTYNFQKHAKAHKERFCTKCEKMFKTKKEFEHHNKKFHHKKCKNCDCYIKIGQTEKQTEQNFKNHYFAKHRH